jgi:serine protease Do
MHTSDISLRQKSLLSRSLLALVFCSMTLSLTPTGVQSSFAAPDNFTGAAKVAMPAVVSIQVAKRSRGARLGSADEEFLRHFFGRGARPPHGGDPGGDQRGQGSGFIISKDGYILTNNHVVGGADEIEVTLNDGRKLRAELIGADEKSDVAVIKVEERELPFLKIGDSGDLEIGEWVLAVGNPFGLSATLTVGVISAMGRAGMGITDYEEFIQTDAAINPGNSGGPLLNIRGEVIGINTAIYSRSGGYMGIGFAIPINMALKIKDQLIQFGEVRRGKIGAYIQELTPDLARELGLKDQTGVLITEVIPDSPADRGGMRAGDVVVKLDGHKIESAAHFRNRVSLTQPDTVATLKVVRDGEKKTLRVTIGSLNPSRGEREPRRPRGEKRQVADEYGLEVITLNQSTRERLRLGSRGGVLINHVEPRSIADRAGLRRGQVILRVNQAEVDSVTRFREVVSQARGALVVQVKGERGVRFIVLKKER